MSQKTKDWFKAQLVAHGVPLPAASAKKEEYQKLYDEKVRPRENNTEFSSDDDADPMGDPIRMSEFHQENKQRASATKWVEKLGDANLLDALKANGKNPGPIVGSTRAFYAKMLIEMMTEDSGRVVENIQGYLVTHPEARENWNNSEVETNGHSEEAVTNGNGHENGYSDSDEEEELERASRASRSSRSSSRQPPAGTPSPKVPTGSKLKAAEEEEEEEEDEDDDVVEIPTPGPSTSTSFRSPRGGSGPAVDTLFYRGPSTSQTTSYSYINPRASGGLYETPRSPSSRAAESRFNPENQAQNQGPGRFRGALSKFGSSLLILASIVVVAGIGFYFSDGNGGANVSVVEQQQDEVDGILKAMDEFPGAT